MTAELVARCAQCDTDIVPGTIYCWRHPADPPKVGRFSVDHGQLLWTAVGCKGAAERAVAVLVGGAQVAVRDLSEALDARPARLLIDYVPAGAPPGTSPSTADVPLSRLLEQLLDGAELIETVTLPR